MQFHFKLRKRMVVCATLAAATLLTVACGGGGSASSTAGVALEGTAASGAPFPSGSVLSVIDKTGAVVATTTLTRSDGSYSVNVPATAVAPLVLVVTADGIEPLVSIVPALVASTVNVTPITNLIASRLSPSGDPAKLADELKAGTATADTVAVNAKKAEIQALLATLTGGLSDTTDALNGRFTATGTGHDQVLDSIKIVIQPAGTTTANIEIGVKQTQADNSAPTAVTFVGGAGAPATPPALPAVTTANLVPSGTSAAIQNLLTLMQDCYALPQASRVATVYSGSNTAAASDILPGACKDMFHVSNPSNYKHNSYTIGNGATNKAWAFKGVWRNTSSGTNGVKFDRPAYEFSRPNTDVVFTARWTDVSGNSAVETYVARRQANNSLRLIGNQSDYDLDVSPRVEYRDLLHDNLAAYSFLNVGYNLYAADTASIGKIVVTTPSNKTLVLKRITSGSYSYMGLEKSSGTISTTSVVRMAAAYVTTPIVTSSPNNHPSDIEPSLFWTWNSGTNTPQNWTDADIAAIPNQGNWKFEIYSDVAGTNLLATEYRRTIGRAPTIAEARAVIWPTINTAARADLKALTATNGGYGFTVSQGIDLSGSGNTNAWEVPTGAWSPFSAKAYGRDFGNANKTFDDEATFATTARKTVIYCSDQDGSGTSDQHCTGTNNNLFKAGVTGDGIGSLQFNGRDARRTVNTLTLVFKKAI
jgi:hypothetical protein